MDRYGYTAPSRVKVLVVPVNDTLEADFTGFYHQLAPHNEIRLADLETLGLFQFFSPQGCPQGRVMFDMMTQAIDTELLFLHDFEPFRKTFVVLGIGHAGGIDREAAVAQLAKRYPSVPVHLLVLFGESTSECTKTSIEVSRTEGTEDESTKVQTKQNGSTGNTGSADTEPTGNTELTHGASGTDGSDKTNPSSLAPSSPPHSPAPASSPASSPTSSHVFYHTGDNASAIMAELATVFLHTLDSYALSFANITLRLPVLIKDSHTLAKAISLAQKRSLSHKPAAPEANPKLKAAIRHAGRHAKLMGNFQLLAGRYPQALALFTELLAPLKKCDDYLWLGLAIEGIAIACVLMQYVHVSYTLHKSVGSVLHIGHKRFPSLGGSSSFGSSYNSSGSSSGGANSGGTVAAAVAGADDEHRALLELLLRRLLALFQHTELSLMPLPDLVKRVLARVVHYYHLLIADVENMVPDVVYVDLILRTIKFMLAVYLGHNEMLERTMAAIVRLEVLEETPCAAPPAHTWFLRSDILQAIERVFLLLIADINLGEQCRIYLVLALMYTDLGLHRKRAFILRLLMMRILPQLEAHSAKADTELAAAEGHQQAATVHDIFGFLFDMYGIPKDPEATGRWTSLQIPLLKLGLRVAEATWDHPFLLRLCDILLLRFSHCLTVEDQVLIKDKVDRVLRAHPGLSAGYWDPRLVRSVAMTVRDDDPVQDKRSVTNVGLVGGRPATTPKLVAEPFFDPYNKAKAPVAQAAVLVQDDEYRCTVELQNPFAFSITVTGIELATTGAKVATVATSTVVGTPALGLAASDRALAKVRGSLRAASPGELLHHLALPAPEVVVSPRLTRIVDVTFKPVSSGPLEITGVKAQVDLCLAREFTPAAPVSATVVPPQPKLSLTKVLLTNGLVLLLEGEKHQFAIELTNYSEETVNYLSFLFWDSTTDPLAARLDQPGQHLPPLDYYELEWQLQAVPFRILDKEQIVAKYKTIAPHADLKVGLEVRGKKAMKKAKIIVEYLHTQEVQRTFVKYVTVTLTVAITGLLEVFCSDVLPMFATVAHPPHPLLALVSKFLEDKAPGADLLDYCLLVVDVRNLAAHPLEGTLRYDDTEAASCLDPGKLFRFMFPIKRAPPPDTKPIPSLRNKQYVKNYNYTDAEDTRMRQLFWLRQHLLLHLSGEWRMPGTSRAGTIDVRAVRLTQRMADALVLQYVKVSTAITDEHGEQVVPDGDYYRLAVNTNYTLCTSVSNTGTAAIHGILRHLPHDKSIDRRILVNGVLQRPLPQTKPGESTTVQLDFVVLERGEYPWVLVVDNQETHVKNSFVITAA